MLDAANAYNGETDVLSHGIGENAREFHVFTFGNVVQQYTAKGLSPLRYAVKQVLSTGGQHRNTHHMICQQHVVWLSRCCRNPSGFRAV